MVLPTFFVGVRGCFSRELRDGLRDRLAQLQLRLLIVWLLHQRLLLCLLLVLGVYMHDNICNECKDEMQ